MEKYYHGTKYAKMFDDPFYHINGKISTVDVHATPRTPANYHRQDISTTNSTIVSSPKINTEAVIPSSVKINTEAVMPSSGTINTEAVIPSSVTINTDSNTNFTIEVSNESSDEEMNEFMSQPQCSISLLNDISTNFRACFVNRY